MSKLIIKNLHVRTNGAEILRGIDLELAEGETLALLGPNGHGKSTLLGAIMGNPAYEITAGSISLDDLDLLPLTPDKRSQAGLFLAMQNPVEIPGLNSADFLKAALNAHRGKPIGLLEFYTSLQQAYKEVGIPFEMSKRNLNEGFSGGEKKRNEVLQLAILEPRLAILDETDSGLDIDALEVVANGINGLRSRDRAIVLVTHYQRLLNYIKPDVVHVLAHGRILKSGGPELALELEQRGYGWVEQEATAAA